MDASSQQQMGRRHVLGPPGTTLNTITPCAACKLLRRRCVEECPFSPYFSPHEPHKFLAVHKVFGASNVSKMLMLSIKSLLAELNAERCEILRYKCREAANTHDDDAMVSSVAMTELPQAPPTPTPPSLVVVVTSSSAPSNFSCDQL